MKEPLDADLVGSAKPFTEPFTEEAILGLYREHDSYLRRFIPSFLRAKGCHSPNNHAEGVMSRAWVAVLNKLDHLRRPDQFRSWITMIAANAARKHLFECIRSQLREESLDVSRDLGSTTTAKVESGQRVMDAAIDAARVYEMANEISGEFAEILYLHFWEELSFHEIAELLQMPYAKVRTLYYRNKRKVYEVIALQTHSLERDRNAKMEPGDERDDGFAFECVNYTH